MKSIIILCIINFLPWSSYCASYTGTNAVEAGHYLDNSEGESGFYISSIGHSRSHAWPLIEKYKGKELPSGFDSVDIQNLAAHHVLSHERVKDAMAILNKFNKKGKNPFEYMQQTVQVPLDIELGLSGGIWSDKRKIAKFNSITCTTIVLQHFGPKSDINADAPVHILTFYPIEEKPPKYIC